MARHDEETRAQVMAALLQGQSIDQAAEAYSVPRSTVARWRKRARGLLGELDAGGTDVEEIGGALLAYLRAGLESVRKQQEVFSDPTWLREQSASELAVLHGVQLDKLVRLLEALEGSGVQPATSSGNGHPRNRVRGHV
ncbi:MAG: helix-turn-helix domain-containing protein [Gemmatimonadota bacterium]